MKEEETSYSDAVWFTVGAVALIAALVLGYNHLVLFGLLFLLIGLVFIAHSCIQFGDNSCKGESSKLKTYRPRDYDALAKRQEKWLEKNGYAEGVYLEKDGECYSVKKVCNQGGGIIVKYAGRDTVCISPLNSPDMYCYEWVERITGRWNTLFSTEKAALDAYKSITKKEKELEAAKERMNDMHKDDFVRKLTKGEIND